MKEFFDEIRPLFPKNRLKQHHVDNINLILEESKGLPVSFRAYILATALHETAFTMRPVREAYWLSESYRKNNLRYWPWYGRGYVQITWEDNYKKAQDKLDIDLTTDPDVVMKPEVAVKILVRGCDEGWFTKYKLSDFLPGDYVNSRRVVNKLDHAEDIAEYAEVFEKALLKIKPEEKGLTKLFKRLFG